MSKDLQNQIDEIQKQYYESNKKNTLFKKAQKNDLAQQVSSNIDITTLLNNTCYIIESTNNVIIDYTVFKLYIHSKLYDTLINHICSIFELVLMNNLEYNIHINLNGFTISAAERYKEFISKFTSQVMTRTDEKFSKQLIKLSIYYPPSVIETIKKMFMSFVHRDIKEKVNIIEKSKSEELYKQLFK